MTNSSICPRRRRAFLILLVFVQLIASSFLTINAAGELRKKPLSHYLREEWGSERGFPGGHINVIAQTPDGYLWIGTQKGLVRFDGREFHLFSQSDSNGTRIGAVLGLVADGAGDLWIRLEGPSLLRYRNGKFEDLTNSFEIPEVAVTQMFCSPDGRPVFATIMNGTVVYDQGKFRTIAPAPHLPNFLVTSLAIGPDGQYFLGSRDIGLFRIRAGQLVPAQDISRYRQINALLFDKEGHLWIGTDKGIFTWNNQNLIHVGLGSSLGERQILSLSGDADGSMWVGTDRGLYRLDPADKFQSRNENLADNGPVSAVYEDREHNIWVESSRGLERLRNSIFTTYSSADGPLGESNGPVYGDADGRIWFAPTKGGLYWLRDKRIERVSAAGFDKDVIYSLAGGNGDVWVARQLGGLTHLRDIGGKWDAVTYTKRDGLPQDTIFTVRVTRNGTVWAGTLNAGVVRIMGGRFTTFTTENGLPSNAIAGILESSDGTIWIATPRGLSGYSNGRWFSISSKDGLPSDDLDCLFEDSAGILWIGTARGLTALRSGKVVTPASTPEALREPILGIREDRLGSLWISTSNHVLTIDRAKFLSQEFDENDMRDFDAADGLRDATGIKRDESIALDGAGQVWFSLNLGLATADTNRLRAGSPPTILGLTGLFADGKLLPMQEPVRAWHPQRLTIDYAGLSLSVPDRIRFKYRLDGFDHGWSAPVSARQATYTNLNSGSYSFHVIASNSEGLWNSQELRVSFAIEPVFWRTWWFALLCSMVFLVLLYGVFRLRFRQLRQQFQVGLEARVDERTRIARELHDTLLQSLHGLMFQFQAARNLLPGRPEQAIQTLDSALTATEQAIAEGRGAIHDLRRDPVSRSDLTELLKATGHDLAGTRRADRLPPAFKLIVEGNRQPLSAVLQDEVYRIAREVLRNAFQHAQAERIEAEIRYDERELRLRIRDDGKGIDPKVLKEGGSSGHWGLRGIRERAKRIGARLDFWSEAGAGTEVELTVPGKIAYENALDGRAFRLFRRAGTHEQ